MIIRHLIISLLLVGATAAAATADRIDLRRSIRRASADTPLLLEEIARIEGEHARRFADLVVLPIDEASSERIERIHVADVRRMLDAAGVDWGRVDLAGGEVTVRPAIVRSTEPAGAGEASDRTAPVFQTTVQSTDVPAPPAFDRFRSLNEVSSAADGTPISAIARQIATHWSLEGADLDTILINADLSSLDRLPADVATYRLTVVAEALTDLIHVKVEGIDTAGRHPAVLVSVQVRRLAEVPVAIASVGAGRPIRGLGVDVAIERHPVRPSVLEDPRRLVDVRAVSDRKPRRALSPGDVLTRDLLVPAKVISRGEEVTVESRIGGYRITYKAIATSDGLSDGRVMCRAIDGDRTAIFEAQVVGSGLVELVSHAH